MTFEEYKEKANADSEWAPGWLLIDEQFERLYPGIEPEHYGSGLQRLYHYRHFGIAGY